MLKAIDREKSIVELAHTQKQARIRSTYFKLTEGSVDGGPHYSMKCISK